MARVAVISDIHGNSWALDAVLADIAGRGADLIVNLGDSVWGSLDPAGTVDRLQAHRVLSIAGNQDRILFEENATVQASADYRFVTAELGAERLAWLRALPATRELGEIFLGHGTPAQDDLYLLETVTPYGVRLATPAEIGARLGAVSHPVVLCGHSHLPRIVWLEGRQMLVNPGSVGIPAYDHDQPYPHVMETGSPHARYAMLVRTDEGWAVEHFVVRYPWAEAAAVARRNGRADRARWIETGRV